MITDSSSASLVAAAVLSGTAFAAMGVVYRLGESRGVRPPHLGVCLAVCGAVFFGGRVLLASARSDAGAPWVVWVLALVAGAGQGGTVHLIGPARARGPFSPIWCAMNLPFVPATLYALAFLGERLGPAQWGGLAAAVLCIGASAAAGEPFGTRRTSGGRLGEHPLAYGALLATIVVCQGLTAISLKYLNARPFGGTGSLLDAFGDLYLLVFYLGLGLVGASDALARGRMPPRLGALLALGIAIGACSVLGMHMYAACAALPGGAGFALSSSTTILGVALVSGFVLGERRGAAWYASVALAVAAVVLFSVR
jgi:drug/metabolite transporter (DMT)-like permease